MAEIKMVNVRWTGKANVTVMRCACGGAVFDHPFDREIIVCPWCGAQALFKVVRERWHRRK